MCLVSTDVGLIQENGAVLYPASVTTSVYCTEIAAMITWFTVRVTRPGKM